MGVLLALLPGGELFASRAFELLQMSFGLFDLSREFIDLAACLLIDQRQRRGRYSRGEVGVQATLIDVVEERREGVELLLLQGVELVVVTPCALEGQTEKCGGKGLGAIRNILGAIFLLDAAALVGLAVKPLKGGGKDLILGRIFQQIPRDLPGD